MTGKYTVTFSIKRTIQFLIDLFANRRLFIQIKLVYKKSIHSAPVPAIFFILF